MQSSDCLGRYGVNITFMKICYHHYWSSEIQLILIIVQFLTFCCFLNALYCLLGYVIICALIINTSRTVSIHHHSYCSINSAAAKRFRTPLVSRQAPCVHGSPITFSNWLRCCMVFPEVSSIFSIFRHDAEVKLRLTSLLHRCAQVQSMNAAHVLCTFCIRGNYRNNSNNNNNTTIYKVS